MKLITTIAKLLIRLEFDLLVDNEDKIFNEISNEYELEFKDTVKVK